VQPVGFTSVDRYDPQVPRTRGFFHLAGRSGAKRTQLVLDAWAHHPEWPTLTVIQHPRVAGHRPAAANIVHRIDYVDDQELRRLQNENLFHLCPSETEGFGHYLMEALSAGAVTLTTDAEPMNELVTEARGLLIPFAKTLPQRLATRYLIDEVGLEAAVERALAMTDEELALRSQAARDFYLRNDAEFRQRLVMAVAVAAGDAIDDEIAGRSAVARHPSGEALDIA
jgi:glycosyltransferase involved in cell wall biosynthesis